MRRSDGFQHQSTFGRIVGAKAIARDLCITIQPRNTFANRLRRSRVIGDCIPADITDCCDNLCIAGAAAQNPAKCLARLILCRFGDVRHQFRRHHQHARRADTALRGPVAQEGCPQSGERVGLRLYRFNAASVHTRHWRQTGADRAPVDQNGAGTAIAGVTPHLGAFQTGFFAQNL